MKKIVVFDTAIGTSNLGDEIIFSAVRDNMQEIFNLGTSMRLGTHVANFSHLQMLKKGFKVQFCQDADLKFICGTNILAQRMIGKINAQWQLSRYNSSIYNGCIMIGVGATDSGNKMDFYAKSLYKKILSKRYIHSVRDEQTKQMLESLGFQAINTGCPSLWKFTPEFCKTIPTTKGKDCILSINGYKQHQDFLSDQKMIDIIRRNYNNCWIWIQTTEDEKYFNTLNNTDGIKKIYSLDEYKRVLTQNEVDYIGSRLHGGVFALQNAVRSIIICIDHRVVGFHKLNHLPVIKKDEIETKLEDMINSEFSTDIIVDQDAISMFKRQFL